MSLNDWLARRYRIGSSPSAPLHVLVMGTELDTHHVGVKAYKDSFRAIFSGTDVVLTFAHPYDITRSGGDEEDTSPQLSRWDIVFVNVLRYVDPDEYAKNVLDMVIKSTVPIYAVVTDASIVRLKSLDVFDHVIVRASADVEYVASHIGRENVTYLPDVIVGWRHRLQRGRRTFLYSFPLYPRQVCVCMPSENEFRMLVYNNESFELVAQYFVELVRAIERVAFRTSSRVSIMSLESSEDRFTGGEDRLATTEAIMSRVTSAASSAYTHRIPFMRNFQNARSVLYRSVAAITVGYYSLLFGAQEGVPVFSLYSNVDTSSKHLADDIRLRETHRLVINTDDLNEHIYLIREKGLLEGRISAAILPRDMRFGDRIAYDMEPIRLAFERNIQSMLASVVSKRKIISFAKLGRPIHALPYSLESGISDDQIHDTVVRALAKVAGAQEERKVQEWYRGARQDTTLKNKFVDTESRHVAHTIAYAITGSLSSALVFDVYNELSKRREKNAEEGALSAWVQTRIEKLRLREQEDKTHDADEEYHERVSYPLPTNTIMADVDALSIDPLHHFLDASWKEAVRGMRYFSPTYQNRPSAPYVLIDQHVERSFLWSKSTLSATGVLPGFKNANGGFFKRLPGYSNLWAGFVHHMSDESLARDPVFIDSMKSCAALYAFSRQTAHHLDRALRYVSGLSERNRPLVFQIPCPLPHARAFDPDFDGPPPAQFSMRKFLDNEDRKLVQVGTWLRRVYAVYELHLYPGSPVTKKAILVNFPAVPTPALSLHAVPHNWDAFARTLSSQAQQVWREEHEDLGANDCDAGGGGICRPCITSEQEWMCRPTASPCTNQYARNMERALLEKKGSVVDVRVNDRREYEELLSRNAVFLNLSDASCVDVVHDCIAANAPVFVNRLPALEDTLGRDYPGFYDSMQHASELIRSLDTYTRAHTHLVRNVDKRELSLGRFVTRFYETLTHAARRKHRLILPLVR